MARHNNRAEYILFDKWPDRYLVFRRRAGMLSYIDGNVHYSSWLDQSTTSEIHKSEYNISEGDYKRIITEHTLAPRECKSFTRGMGKRGFRAKNMRWHQVQQYIFNLKKDEFLETL